MEKVGEFDLLPKKEVTLLKAERDKLEKNLGGIKDMRELPGVVFVVDPNVEHICVNECKLLNIPMVGLVDTNGNPDNIEIVIPGNDDAIRSVKLIASAIADAVIEAKEGVSLKKDEPQDEDIDIEKVLAETKPNLEIAEAGEESRKKPAKKKPAKKKPEVKKESKETEITEEKKEVEDK